MPTVRIILTRILVALLRISHLKENFTVNAESTYIFVLYVPTEKEHGGNLPESRQKKHETQKLVVIKMVVERLNNGTAKNILFIHTWIGPDATSIGIGKAGVKLYIKKSGMYYKRFHGFLKIIRLTDRKLYYLSFHFNLS